MFALTLLCCPIEDVRDHVVAPFDCRNAESCTVLRMHGSDVTCADRSRCPGGDRERKIITIILAFTRHPTTLPITLSSAATLSTRKWQHSSHGGIVSCSLFPTGQRPQRHCSRCVCDALSHHSTSPSPPMKQGRHSRHFIGFAWTRKNRLRDCILRL